MLRMFNNKFFLGDEGVSALNAWRISQGQVPHLDFFEIVPPASFFPLAAAFRLFGQSVLVERMVTLLVGALLLVLVDRLSSRFTQDPRARTLAVVSLALFGVSYWPLPSHHWIVALCQLGALLCLHRALSSARPLRWAAAAGALSALGCFSLQDQGGYFLVALCLLYFPLLPGWRSRATFFGAWALGGGLVALGFAAYLLPHVALGELVWQWFLFPMGRYKQIAGNAGSLLSGWKELGAFWGSERWLSRPLYGVSMTVAWSFVLLAPWISLAVLFWAAIRKWRPRPELGLLGAGWLAFFCTAAHRWSLTNLAWALPAFLPLCVWAVSRGLEAESRRLRLLSRVLLALAVAGFVTHGLVLMADASLGRSYGVQGRAGTLRSLVPEQSALLQQAVSAVEAHVPQGEALFTSGFIPLVNFMTLTPPPTRYNYFMYPVYHTEAQADEVIRTLEEKRVRFALLIKPVAPDNRLSAYFLARFRPLWSNKVAVLMERSSGAPEPPVGTRSPGASGQGDGGTTTAR